MASELTILQVSLEDRPGALAEAARAVAEAGVNLEGVLAYTAAGESAAQFVVSDEFAARAALEHAGHSIVGVRDVFAVPLEDQPGALAELTQRLADAGINLSLAYLATGNRLLLAADHPEQARPLL
jgi:hypothetical protein